MDFTTMTIRRPGVWKSLCGSVMAVAGLAIAAGCGGCVSKAPTGAEKGAGGTPQTKAATTATINIEGSSTVFLISQAMANEFEKSTRHKVSVSRSGTGGGYKKFVLRQSDLWNASRPIAEREAAELKEKGIDWLELEVAIDGLSIAVHPKNDWCQELTVGQLRQLWAPDSTFNKWSDVNPAWPDQPIEFFGADTDSGTFEYFTEVIVGKKGSSRTNYQAASDDNVLIRGVAGSKYSLGYIPFGYCVQNKGSVKVIKVSPTIEGTPEPSIEPTVETILSGDYKPLARPLYVYVNKETLQRSEVVEFLKFMVSEASQPLVAKRGFVRLPDARRQEMAARLETALKPAAAEPAK